MSLTRSLIRFRNRNKKKSGNGNGNGNGKKKIPLRQNKLIFEPLEPRLLLSDMSYSAAPGVAIDAILKLQKDDGADTLQLINNKDGSVLQSQAASETAAVVITGSEQDDKLTVDLSTPFSTPMAFNDPCKNDNDTLQVIGGDNTSTLSGTEGAVSGVNFSGIENVMVAGDGNGAYVFGRPFTDAQKTADGNTGYIGDQVFYLDLTGAEDITYEGPVVISGFDMPAFQAPEDLKGQESTILSSLLASLQERFANTEIVFTTEQPSSSTEYSTIYIGGDGSAFSQYGLFTGVSEKIDKGDLDRTDSAFIFTDNAPSVGLTAGDFGAEIAVYVSHEAGHLMGYQHAYQVEPDNPLSAVAYKPYVHIEIAKDVRNDLLEDGKLTVAGGEYPVNPLIIEALKKYPSYYYAGAVGPDGFPDLIMGQTVLHPDSTGLWVSHILDKAWEVQSSDRYSPRRSCRPLPGPMGSPCTWPGTCGPTPWSMNSRAGSGPT